MKTEEKEVYTMSIGQMTKFLDKARSLGFDDHHMLQVMPVDEKIEFPKIRITNTACSHNSYMSEFMQVSLITMTY